MSVIQTAFLFKSPSPEHSMIFSITFHMLINDLLVDSIYLSSYKPVNFPDFPNKEHSINS